MKREEISKAVGNINTKYIEEAAPDKKVSKRQTTWIKCGAMAASLCLVAAGAIVASSLWGANGGAIVQPVGTGVTDDTHQIIDSDITQSPAANSIVVNELDSPACADMDVQYSFYDDLTDEQRKTVLDEFKTFTGMSYESFIGKIPEAFELDTFYSVLSRSYKDGARSKEYSIHDYAFEYRTKNAGTATIALCSFEAPLRDLFFESDTPQQSLIGGVTVEIFGYSDCYIVQFAFEGVRYDIQTESVSLEELEALLTGIMSSQTKTNGGSGTENAEATSSEISGEQVVADDMEPYQESYNDVTEPENAEPDWED